MKILTLNLLHNAVRWQEREPLVIAELIAEQPDLIAFQEVFLPIAQAEHIAAALNAQQPDNPYQVAQASKWGGESGLEGCAFLSRRPILSHSALNLPQHNRVALIIELDDSGERLRMVNTHLHHMPPYNESIRLEQIRFLMDWLYAPERAAAKTFLMGDFNARPNSVTVAEALKRLNSAYRQANGHEPDSTFPTPLITEHGYGTQVLDYIFIDPGYKAVEAHLIGTRPHSDDPTLYPSDHFGIAATVVQRD